MFRNSLITMPTACALARVLTYRADAQLTPVTISGEGIGPTGLTLPGDDPWPHWIMGLATRVGMHRGAGLSDRRGGSAPDRPGRSLFFRAA